MSFPDQTSARNKYIYFPTIHKFINMLTLNCSSVSGMKQRIEIASAQKNVHNVEITAGVRVTVFDHF